MKKKTRKSTDPAANWFTEAEAIYQEKFRIPLTCYQIKTGMVQTFYLSHTEYDGYSGYLKLIQDSGYFLEGLPSFRSSPKPGLFRRLLAILRFYRMSAQRRSIFWKYYDPEKRATEKKMNFLILTPEETGAVEEACQKTGAGISPFLLWTLDQALSPLLTVQESPRMWMYSLNFRASLGYPETPGNQSVYLGLELRKSDTPNSIRNRIRREYRLGADWGCWLALQLSSRMGRGMTRRSIRMVIRRNIQWFGSFAHLGSWSPVHPDRERMENEVWFGCTDVTPNKPVGAGSIIWGRRLILSLLYHPSICTGEGQVMEGLNLWKEKIFQSIQEISQ